jgi:hypothetical protein
MRSCVLSGARWMQSGVSSLPSRFVKTRSKRSGTAKSTWFVASVNSRPMALQICTSILGP